MTDLSIREENGVEFLTSSLLEECGFVRHAFSTRRGGVSEGPFRSLNLGQAAGEDPERVQENQQRFFRAAGLIDARLVAVRQVHGTEIVDVAEIPDREIVSADGIITDNPGVLLTIQTADCIPVLMVDPNRRAVAAVHAGRVGTASGILKTAVARMEERFESDPKDLIVALGPAISGACYEVPDECLVPFRGRYSGWRDFSRHIGGGQWLLDLPEAARHQLIAAGVPEEQIRRTPYCTFSESARFFSYRRDGSPTGRLMGAIGIF